MTDDYIENSFADLDVYYPGSKRKRREPAKSEVEPNLDWDAKPYKKTLPNGKDVDMFTIGAIANALGRPLITVRAWIKEGYLPASPYRLPTKKNVKGEDHLGRRLYTRPMIEAAVELFGKHGLLNVKRIEWSNHQQLSADIAEAWNNIRAQETKTTETKG
jgi:hypothetical protein